MNHIDPCYDQGMAWVRAEVDCRVHPSPEHPENPVVVVQTRMLVTGGSPRDVRCMSNTRPSSRIRASSARGIEPPCRSSSTTTITIKGRNTWAIMRQNIAHTFYIKHLCHAANSNQRLPRRAPVPGLTKACRRLPPAYAHSSLRLPAAPDAQR